MLFVKVKDFVNSGEIEIKTGPFGTQLKAHEYTREGTPVLNVRNLGFSDVRTDKLEYVGADTTERLSIHLLREGDIVFGRKGAVERHSFITAREDGWMQGSDCIRLRILSNRINPRYLSYFFLTKKHQAYMMSACSHGTTMASLNQGILEQIVFPLPPREVQDRIVSILLSLDKKRDLNQQINDNLASQIEALLIAFLDSEDAMPVKLGDYLYIKGRIGWKGLKKSEYLPQSGFRIINGETLTQSGIDWNKAGYISEERYVESPEIMLKVGDILLSKDGTIGKIGYVDSLELPTSVASGIFVIRNTKPDVISTTFIYYLLKSRLFNSFISARTEGSVIPHLYQKDFMEFEFPLPSPNKMAEFEEITAPMFSQIVNNLNENKRLSMLRDSLLPKLMSGELDVSELDI